MRPHGRAATATREGLASPPHGGSDVRTRHRPWLSSGTTHGVPEANALRGPTRPRRLMPPAGGPVRTRAPRPRATLLDVRAPAQQAEAGVEEVAGGRDREHGGDGAPGAPGSPRAGRPVRGRSTRPGSGCTTAAPRPRSAGGGPSGAGPRPLVDEGWRTQLHLLVHDQLRQGEVAADSGTNSRGEIAAVRRAPGRDAGERRAVAERQLA